MVTIPTNSPPVSSTTRTKHPDVLSTATTNPESASPPSARATWWRSRWISVVSLSTLAIGMLCCKLQSGPSAVARRSLDGSVAPLVSRDVMRLLVEPFSRILTDGSVTALITDAATSGQWTVTIVISRTPNQPLAHAKDVGVQLFDRD